MCNIYHEHSHVLSTTADIRNYIFGGKGVVTLLSPTGVHHTYAFQPPKQNDSFTSNTLFVSTLVGENSWKYVGMLSANRTFKATRGSKFPTNSAIFKGAAYIVKMMYTENLNTPMQLYYEGCCSVCGRPLTNPKSIAIGIGPKCKERYLHV